MTSAATIPIAIAARLTSGQGGAAVVLEVEAVGIVRSGPAVPLKKLWACLCVLKSLQSTSECPSQPFGRYYLAFFVVGFFVAAGFWWASGPGSPWPPQLRRGLPWRGPWVAAASGLTVVEPPQPITTMAASAMSSFRTLIPH